MRKFTLLLAFGLSFLWSTPVSAKAVTNSQWSTLTWLATGGYQQSDWEDIDNGIVFYNKKSAVPFVRMGSAYFYFESNHHHVYINELEVTLKWVSSYAYNPQYCICEKTINLKSGHTGSEHNVQNLSVGTTLKFKSIKEYIHVWYNSQSTDRCSINISNWTNITHSTSEGGYKNYLHNAETESDRTPNYFEVDEHGDGTYLLHPGWKCDSHNDYYDHDGSNKITARNWTGENDYVIDMCDLYDGKYGGWQEVTLDHDGVYTVQAIVRGPAGQNVTLELSSGGATNTSTQPVYGMADNSPSTVNTFGRVDYWDMGTNAGWTKVETSVYVAANGVLRIHLSSDDDFQVSDVTLLLGANDENNDECFWTTAALDEDNTSRQMLSTKYFTFVQGFYGTSITIHYPKYNKFSFFDRGTNKNGVVYAHPKTVIGMPVGMADYQDHAHECNVAVPYYNINTLYSYGSENNVEEETNITCKKLKLTDTDGSQWGNIHAFGLPEGKHFTAAEVTFDREYKNGQKSTCVFPFAMTSSELTDFFGSNKIYEFEGIDGTNANFNEVTSGSTANKPFLVYPSKDGSISLGEKTIVASSNTITEDGAGNRFIGVYRYTAFPAGYSQDTSKPLTYMFNAASATGYYGGISKNGADIKPFRAYMEVPRGATASPAKFFVNFLFNEATAISDIFQEKTGQPTIYRLDGTRVANSYGLRKGIYIVNGKKLILK